MRSDTIELFHQHINAITQSITFTKEIETNNSISFLDVKVTRQANGSLHTNIHKKPTHTNRYLQYNSHHPLQHKLSVPKTLYDRNDKLITNKHDKKKENKQIYHTLKLNGFPKKLAERHTHTHVSNNFKKAPQQ